MNGVAQLTGIVPRPPVVDRVNLTFRQSSYAPLREVSADEIDGTIVLTGRVPSYYLKQIAQVVAGAVEGVRRLENRTVVAAEETRSLRGTWRTDRRMSGE
jgi:hypothetical protein